MPNTELELFILLSKGNETGFAKFVNNITSTTFPYVLDIVKNSNTAEELTTRVVYKLWEKQRTNPQPINNPEGWVKRSLKHAAYNILRRKKVVRKYWAHQASQQENPSEELERYLNHIDKKNYLEILHHILSLIPKRRRDIFYMRVIKDMPIKQISRALKITEGRVHTQLKATRDFIMKYVAENKHLFAHAGLVSAMSEVLLVNIS